MFILTIYTAYCTKIFSYCNNENKKGKENVFTWKGQNRIVLLVKNQIIYIENTKKYTNCIIEIVTGHSMVTDPKVNKHVFIYKHQTIGN